MLLTQPDNILIAAGSMLLEINYNKYLKLINE